MIPEYDGVESVSLAAYEAQAERNVRTVKYLVLGWVLTTIALCLALIVSMSYTEETITETTTAEVMQNADNDGTNYYAGGDMNGSETDSNKNQDSNA